MNSLKKDGSGRGYEPYCRVARGKETMRLEFWPKEGQDVDGLAILVDLSYLLSLLTSTTAVGTLDDDTLHDNDDLLSCSFLLLIPYAFALVIAVFSCHYASQNWADSLSRLGAGYRSATLVDRG